jgi:hypothetical protein
MLGPNTLNPGPTPLADSSDDSEYSSTEYDHGNSTGPRTAPGSRHRERTIRPGGHESDALSDSGLAPNDFSADFLTMEPESDHASDSDSTKHDKRATRRTYRAKLNLLKYQQSFIKNEPPFVYSGDANATTFKKWVREVRDWKERARLTTNQSLRMIGKYLSGQAYRFYERDILDLQKGYSLTEFFEQLFDYVFPPDFRMQQ